MWNCCLNKYQGDTGLFPLQSIWGSWKQHRLRCSIWDFLLVHKANKAEWRAGQKTYQFYHKARLFQPVIACMWWNLNFKATTSKQSLVENNQSPCWIHKLFVSWTFTCEKLCSFKSRPANSLPTTLRLALMISLLCALVIAVPLGQVSRIEIAQNCIL